MWALPTVYVGPFAMTQLLFSFAIINEISRQKPFPGNISLFFPNKRIFFQKDTVNRP